MNKKLMMILGVLLITALLVPSISAQELALVTGNVQQSFSLVITPQDNINQVFAMGSNPFTMGSASVSANVPWQLSAADNMPPSGGMAKPPANAGYLTETNTTTGLYVPAVKLATRFKIGVDAGTQYDMGSTPVTVFAGAPETTTHSVKGSQLIVAGDQRLGGTNYYWTQFVISGGPA